MPEWTIMTLGALLERPEAGTRPAGGVGRDSGEIPSLGGENIHWAGGVVYEPVNRVSRAFFQRMQRGVLRDGDVLINKDGAQTGKVGLYRAAHYSEACINEHVFILRSRSGAMHPTFLFHFLNSENAQLSLRPFVTGSAQAGLKASFVDHVRFACPPLQEQQAIARIFDAADEAIAKTEALIAKLKAIKQGLLHDLLTRGLDDKGELRDPAKRPGDFYTTPLGIRPKHWTLQRLGQMCDLLNGIAFKPGDWTRTGLPIIRIQNLNRGEEFNYYDGVVADKYYIDPGTLLFSWSGNRGTSFGPFIWPGPRGILNQHIFKVTAKEGVRTLWFYYALDDVRQRVERVAHGGSGLVHIRRPDLCEYLIATPEEDEQERIETAVATHDDRIHSEEVYLGKLRSLKKGLMRDLLSGRVRATQKAEAEEQRYAVQG